jgi:hypothetical protein
MLVFQKLFDTSLRKFYSLLESRCVSLKCDKVCYSRESIQKDISNMSKLELKEYAEKMGIKLDRRKTLKTMKQELFNKL